MIAVYLGLTDVTEVEETPSYRVLDLLIHPGWNLASKDSDILAGHDLALLRLPSPLTRLPPVCLPGQEEGAGYSCYGLFYKSSVFGPGTLIF